MSEDSKILIPTKLFRDIRMVLTFANEILVNRGERFDAMDQNPHGIRDLVGSVHLDVERFVKGK